EPGVAIAGGGGDARHLGNQGGIPAIYYGPGNVVMAHSTDEYIELDNYIETIKVLAVAIYRWCNGV
ncbi:MAG: M20/M25/M40 family metallo-hydrolase, partial [Spirochaetia bacterium]|nr:M20/M25/M40 family metallo-hydrolase [Spirochaetia bacterium]